MAYEKDVVIVNITLGTRTITQAGFGTELIVGATAGRIPACSIRFYSDLPGVAADYQSNDPEYLAAASYFAQSPAPDSLAIAYAALIAHQDSTQTLTVDNVVLDDYVVTVNGHEVTYTNHNSSATVQDIAAGLALLIQAADALVEVAVGAGQSGVITMTMVDSSIDATEQDENLTLGALVTHVAAYTYTDFLNDIVLTTLGNNWYALNALGVGSSAVYASQVADWAEGNYKLNGIDITGADAITSQGDNVTNTLFASAYKRTFAFYNGTDAQYQVSAWFGAMLPTTPGAATWALKTLAGVPVDNLSETQIGYLRANNINFYEYIGGVNLTRDGKVCSGEWIDNVVFADWLQASCEEAVFYVLVNNLKVPYTDDGISLLAAAVTGVLIEGKSNGGIDDYTVTQILAKNISAIQKSTRKCTAVSFHGTFAGAIQQAEFTGTVTY